MNNKALSTIELERYIAGEVSPNERIKIEELLLKSDALKNQLKKLKQSNIDILQKYPPEKMAALLKQRSQRGLSRNYNEPVKFKKRKFNSGLLVPAFGLFIAGLFLYQFLPRAYYQDATLETDETFEVYTPTDGNRIKGVETKLLAYTRNGSHVDQLTPQSTLHEGENLQLAYFTSSPGYGVIFSVDGRGEITLHFPSTKKAEQKLQSGKNIYLEFSYELDDAPEFEKFFFLQSEKEIDTEELLKLIKKVATRGENIKSKNFKVPGQYKQTTFMILK
ncbi:MAG: hypothetical protein ABUK01_09635 [Leptospirales bacterium]